ncbi:MAG TPA: tail fiber protein [Rhizomicrobium sp.]|nr:tail fiber protein [Rhizomicrobium sp.]
MAEPYIGQIIMAGFNFAPINYAFCQGQLQAISQNEALFSILGTTYGGDGVTTFALPNLQNRSMTNWGQGPGLSNYDIGQVNGSDSVTLTTQQMPMHNHTISAAPASDQELSPTTNGWLGTTAGPGKIYSTLAAPDQIMASSVIQPAGGSQPHENQQPFLCVNFCIALFGIFPSRN